LQTLLAATRQTVKESFGAEVEFTEVSEIDIGKLFAQAPAAVIRARQSSIYDFKHGGGDKRKLGEGINTTLTQRGTTLADGLKFAAPYLPDSHPKDLMDFSNSLAQVLLDRLDGWRKVNLADGLPLLDDAPYNEWIYWDTLGYGKLPYDLIITNQLIASAEYIDVDIHSAIRGGVTLGTTTYSRNNPFGAFVFWSTFPFTDNSEVTLSQRGGERYSASEAAQLSGAGLAHEIGHLLFRFGHPFGQTSCVMNPVSMLQFRAWLQHLDAKQCQIGSRAEMTAGAIPEYYNVNWLRIADTP
jgi:hypothetical protein